MRLLLRSAKPQILVENEADWTRLYLKSDERRPVNARYRHETIVRDLRRMSLDKCFYCEKKLPEGDEQVDHYRDVGMPEKDASKKEREQRRRGAYQWENLYLACKGCNVGKPSQDALPVEDCLDPCGSEPVSAHLFFDGENVYPCSGSKRGENTLRKYRLSRDELCLARAKVLRQLTETYLVFLEKCRAEARGLTEAEHAELECYCAPNAPFSACCAAWLERRGPRRAPPRAKSLRKQRPSGSHRRAP